MNILAVDTTGPLLGIAVTKGSMEFVATLSLKAPHDEVLIDRVARLLKKAGLRMGDLDAIAAASGPGRFTGIRVAMSYAAVAAGQLGIPALAVSRLEAVAFGASSRRAAAVVEGFRGEKFYQLFIKKGPGRKRGIVPRPQGGPAWANAEEWPARAAALSAEGWSLEERRVTADDLLEPARYALRLKKRTPYAPLYIKPANFEKGNNPPRLVR